ncbi:MAG: hypothetical protein KKA61_00115 [Nanoarchaeota archaeon]|nr:hypothetical protein [Nanoarchaeota archaeon]MBU4492754.1 hypothetical protein [Nanoarchaeota archaeon]
MKRAQTWSLDVMVAVGIFIVVVILFFYIINQGSKTSKTEELTAEGETVTDIMTSSGPEENISVVVENIVEQGKVEELANKSYDELKQELGIKGDFYIHFEDEDGNIIYIDEEENIVGIGSDKVIIETT